MDKLKRCAKMYESLFEIKYRIILGRKSKETEIMLSFQKDDFFHLIGLHKLKDVRYPFKNSADNFDAILLDDITYELISKSKHFEPNPDIKWEGIKYRVEYFIHLIDLLDSTNLVFKYNSKINNWSRIKAEYVFESREFDKNLYLFIDIGNGNKDRFCRSFFPEMYVNYTDRQPKMALLYKEKINVRLGESIVQLDKIGISNKSE